MIGGARRAWIERDWLTACCRLAAACMAMLSLPAYAEGMPKCDDPQILQKLKLQFRVLEGMSERPDEITQFTAVHETALGPPPRSANQYANDDVFIAETRYCESPILLKSGGNDSAFWTIHHFKEYGANSYRPDICSLKYDSWEDGCAQWRVSK